MPQANTHAIATRRDDLPLAGRTMELRDFRRAAGDAGELAPLATAKLVFTTGAAVRRYDWYRDRSYMEQLVVEDGAIRLDRLQRGAPLLNAHNSWDLEAQLGVVENPSITAGEGECDATFSRRESVAGYVQDVQDRVIRNVSVGYVRHRVEMVAPAEEGGVWIYRVIDWEPYEVSLVPIPADMDSQVRSGGSSPQADDARQLRTFPCEFIETRASATQSPPTVGISAATLNPGVILMTPEELAAAEATRQAQELATRQAAETAAQAAAVQRAADITDLCARHNVSNLASGLIRGGQTVEQARAAVLDEIAVRDAASGGHRNVQVQTIRDEQATRMAGVQEAILHRVMPSAPLTDNGRQFRGMSLIEIGRDYLEASGVNTRGMARMELAGRMLQHRSAGMHTTSDFASLFANVANKRLRNAYDENPGTYGRWARRAPNAPDFKNMSVVQLSGAPDLLKTNEHGEFKYGSMTDGAETYAMLTYGRIVALSRQAIVNDDLRGFDRLVSAFGSSSRRLENRTVYAQLTANAALADTGALFNATAVTTAGGHANLGTGGGSVLQFSSLTTGRTAMRVQKGLQSEELNLAPSFLIVPAALEQTAYQLTSSNYVPATKAEVNEFRTGGRTALDPIVEPLLDANSATAWYLAAQNSQIDTVEYCYLDGAEGPMIESEMGFETDGISYKCRLDFAAKAVDFRGLYKSAGA
ncbi:MAG: prohead protease/major capsid protein fusion protein [Pseudomonadota bacterium]